MPTPEGVRAAAALARAVDILRRSPEPGASQKTALRALVAFFGDRSATFRHYDNVLTVDAEPVPTTDPRLATFAERLVGQHVAEIAIAQGAGPDELLALALGLAAEPGQGRLKERLRDASSARVMVVYHQYNALADRSVSAAFEKVKIDQAVISEWNKYLEDGARTEAERMQHAGPEPSSTMADATPLVDIGSPPASPAPRASGSRKAAGARRQVQAPPPPRPSQVVQQPPGLQGSSSLGNWFTAFERGFKSKFPEYFGDVDWGWKLDRAAGTVTAADRGGFGTVTVALPEGFVDQSAWILANQLLVELRRRAETEAGVRRKR